ncbi:diadenylate cyclase [Mycoplasma sp. Ms02]|uniref:diadenylate cyclase n=1 Tax=Mycoplasma sp. Ms02 TaxID=353851 RepID=UPI001C8AFA52|nr:diadenylate cyclase [Mycoplasma sp. Ms02]QZE12333.1 diadenylate cyclase [Mycoplasma sp. Ms02]
MEILLLILVLVFVVLIAGLLITPYIVNFVKGKLIKTKYNKLGRSSQIRLINQLREAVGFLSKHKIGAIVTIENTENIDHLRTDGVILNANISSSLLISIFNKESPLHDGAVVIRDNKIYYAATFYKITRKSMDNRYGSRHRAAMGISEICDATTVVVSEESGNISIAKNGTITEVRLDQFQEQLVKYLQD